jgi:hypothetical protein
MSYPSFAPAAPRDNRRGHFRRISALFIIFLLGIFLFNAASVYSQTPAPRPQAHRAKMDDGVRELGTDSRLKNMSQQQQMDLIEFVAGNMLFVGFHELGHGIIHELGLPVLGREEDAADSFATIAMINMNTDFSNRVLVQAARGWFLMDRRDRKDGDALAFYDEHGLDKQRAYQIVCLMVGWDEDKFKELADWVKMPASRQDSCAGDYSNAQFSWNAALKPFRRAPDQPKSKVDFEYGPAKGKLDVFARSFRAIGYLETLAGYAADLVVWPRPISIVMQTCGESNAEWSPGAHKEILCYEMAEEFLQLYQGFSEDKKGKMATNELLARNILRLRSLHTMSQQSLASGSGMDQSWVNRVEHGQENASVAQLEQLARALNVETAELFKQEDTSAAQASQAKRRSRK